MTAHTCPKFDPGCYRCDLSRDETARTRCPACGAGQPTDEEWTTTEEGALPELCWDSDTADCRDKRRETFARLGALLRSEGVDL